MIDLEQAKNESQNFQGTQIEAIVSFDERGQLVIPKDVRKKYDLKAGEKFALVSCKDQKGNFCCFTLMKSTDLQGMVKSFLGPALKDIINDEG